MEQASAAVQGILAKGHFRTTYKLAVLHAILDILACAPECVEIVDVRDIAVRVTCLYWPHVRPYATKRGPRFLRQDELLRDPAQSTILSAIQAYWTTIGLQLKAGEGPQHLVDSYERLVDQVESTLREDPLWRLQVVDGSTEPGIYLETGRAEMRTTKNLHLVPGVYTVLSADADTLREKVQVRWTRFVARRNGIGLSETAIGDLRRFLFPL